MGRRTAGFLIQYSISSDHYRFGWIEKSAPAEGNDRAGAEFPRRAGDQSVAFNRDST